VVSMHYESNSSGAAMVKLVGLAPQNAPVACGLVASLGFPSCPEGALTTWETEAETGLSEAQSIALLRSYIAKGRAAFYDNGAPQRGSSDIRRGDAGLTVSGELSGNLQFKSISGFQDLSRNSRFTSPVPVNFLFGKSHTVDKYYSQEFELLSGTPALNWVVGLYGGYETGQDELVAFSNPGIFAQFGLPLTPTLNNDGIANSSLAAFAQATWQFRPDWHLTVGVRASHDTRKMDADNETMGACDVPAPGLEFTDGTPGTTQCPRWFESSYTKPSWLVSLDHQVTPDILLYGKAAAGYRSGGQNESGQTAIESFASFAPETNVEYETGIKSEFLEHRARVNLDVYYDKYNDLQVTNTVATASGGFATPVTNAASATVRGLELEATAILAPGLSVSA
jgi:iron complex outermembrane receptor protein